MLFSDTIIAIATGPASGAVGILRISGADAYPALQRLFISSDSTSSLRSSPPVFVPRVLRHGTICDVGGQLLDDILAVYMPAPHSFTGEDVVEIHAHGGATNMRRLLREVLRATQDLNLRAADPGEFSRRAYLNGKLDLTQAEAIHGLVTSESESALRAHVANLGGRLKQIVQDTRTQLLDVLSQLEASFEFPDEDIQIYERSSLVLAVKQIDTVLHELLDSYQTSQLCESVFKVAILGPPNVGKSSLLNALLCDDRAIVSEIPGTTRDVVDGYRLISGYKVQFFDTAGLRQSEDTIESSGIERSLTTAERADLVLWLSDDPRENVHVDVNSLYSLQLADKKTLFVLNKVDLLPSPVSESQISAHFHVLLSAVSGFGIPDLLSRIESVLHADRNVQNYVHINERQRNIIYKSIGCLNRLKLMLDDSHFPEELAAAELRFLADILSEITGVIHKDQVMDEVFSKFCIGK